MYRGGTASAAQLHAGRVALVRQAGECRVAIDFRLSFAYAGLVPSSCKVSFTDGAGVTHSVSVAASSLYEACVLALAEFQRCGFADVIAGPATRLTVAVESPATRHQLSVAKVRAWLEGSGKSPNEHALKVRLREVLARA